MTLPPIHSALLLAAGKSRVHFQLPSMVLIKDWCTSEKPWITLVLASSSLCGILGFAKSRIEKTNKRCLWICVLTPCVCTQNQLSFAQALAIGSFPEAPEHSLPLGDNSLISHLARFPCSQPIRNLKCHEDLLPHFAVSIILLLIEKCYCVLWNPACLYPRAVCSECLPFEVQTKSWAFQVLLHYYSIFLYKYIKSSVLYVS